MKRFKYFFLAAIIVWMQAFALFAQANTLRIETPQILNGTVINDSYYYGGISIGTAYTGDAPFMGWERDVFYSLDGGTSWQEAYRRELPFTTQLDFASNSFPGGGFEADIIRMYRAAPEIIETESRAAIITVGIYVKSDYNTIDIAPLDDGNFVATWRKTTAQGYDNIYCQVFSKQGNKLCGEYLVCSQSKQSVYFPKSRVTALENSSFIITWENHLTPTSPQARVQARILRYLNGTVFERNALELNTVTGRHNLAAAIVRIPGGFLAFTRQWWWESNRYFHSGFYGMRYDNSGYSTSALFNITATNSTDTEISNSPPRILTLADGSRVFAWEERPAQLFVQKLNADFSQTGSRIKVADIKAYDWTAATNGTTGFFLSWIDTTNVNIRGQFFTPAGVRDGSLFLVNDKPNTEAYRPYAGQFPDGGFALSWLQYNFNERTYQFTIRKYNPAGQFQVVEFFPEYWAWNFYFGVLQGTNCLASYLNHEDNRDCFLYTGLKSIHTNVISPERDINIQCRLFDPVSKEEWLSPIRSYLYADPDDGKGSTITYADGFTNQNQAKVAINLEPGRYKSLEFYMQRAVLENGQCGVFSEWTLHDPITTLTREVDVSLDNGYCSRFKYIITNMANMKYEITGNPVLCCDTTPPALEILEEQPTQSALALHLTYGDAGSGLERIRYRVNANAELPVTQSDMVLDLINGPNHIKLEAADRAGNITVKHIFKIVELVNPEIRLNGINDGEEYGDDLTFRFESTVPVTEAGLFMDDILVKAVSLGQVNLDLRTYPEGSHTVAVRGRDPEQNLLECARNIIVKHGTFNLVLLTPGQGQYGSRNLPIEYWSSEPVTEIWWELDGGGRQSDLRLTDLADGSHELIFHAINAGDYQKSCSVTFTVREVFPELEILSPINGGIYPGRTVELAFSTNSEVDYTLGETERKAVSGEMISVAEDGEYDLILTATHPVSGNVLRKTVSFNIDSVAPAVTLHSPQSRLYTYNEINIDYSVNKPVYDVNLYLDGEEVDTLRDLKAGSHTFEIRIRDRAGRSAEKRVDFQVARLEITSPQEGEKIIAETYPCVVPFSYIKEGWFETVTQALDNQAGRLVTDPPGEIIPLETSPGEHELHLRGYMNEFNVSRKARFQIGKKNLAAGAGSIGYTYRSLGSDGTYEVFITLKIMNNGDLDIDQPVLVRSDVMSLGGAVVNYWHEIPQLPAKGQVVIELEPVIARFGDLFMVNIDPGRELTGEDPADNNYQLEFQTGQITGVTGSLAAGNVYLSGVSVWNEIQVFTAGPVAYVEIQAGDKIFVDNTPQDGFRTVVDMGLLEAEINYLQISAYGLNGIILDSRKQYYEIKNLPEQMGGYAFPWFQFASEAYNDFDHIVMNETDMEKLFTVKNDLVLGALSHPPCVIPLEDKQKVTYRIFTAVSENRQRAAGSFGTIDEDIPVGDYAGIGGGKKLSNGKGFILEFAFDPATRSCVFISNTPLYINESAIQYRTILQKAWETVITNLDQVLFGGLKLENFFYDRSIGKVSVNDMVSMKRYRSVSNINDFTWTEEFDFSASGGCFICSMIDADKFNIQTDVRYSAKGTGSYNFTIGKQEADADSSDFLLPLIYNSSYSYNSSTHNIPIRVDMSINAMIEGRDGFTILNPVLSHMTQGQNYEGELMNSSSSWSLLSGFLGSSSKFNSHFSLTTSVKADVATVANADLMPVTAVFSDVYGKLNFTVTKRWKKCFLWHCWKGKYNVVDMKRTARAGAPYTDDDIRAFINSY